jgi:VanZ family protein
MAIETTTLPPPGAARRHSRHLVWILLALLIMVFLGWGYVLARLTSASKEGVDHFENRVRQALVHRGYLPRRYRHWYPDHQDLLKHFAFYSPFGVMAAAGAAIRRRAPSHAIPQVITARRIAIALMLLGASLATADEIRQIWNPTRSAEVSDLIAGWLGIGAGFALASFAEMGALGTLHILQRWGMRTPLSHRP